jgi:hypothetical protein
MISIFLFMIVCALLVLAFVVFRMNRLVTSRVALLISGQSTDFEKNASNLSEFVRSLEKQGCKVDVYISTDKRVSTDIPNVLRYEVETDLENTADVNYEMVRVSRLYALVENKQRYDWFVRVRPDSRIIRFAPLSEWSDDKLSAKLRFSSDPDLVDPHAFSNDYPAYAKVNVADDRVYVVPRSIREKAFRVVRGDYIYPSDPSLAYYRSEYQFSNMLRSHGADVHPISWKGGSYRERWYKSV